MMSDLVGQTVYIASRTGDRGDSLVYETLTGVLRSAGEGWLQIESNNGKTYFVPASNIRWVRLEAEEGTRPSTRSVARDRARKNAAVEMDW
jgi:hypothetical protein